MPKITITGNVKVNEDAPPKPRNNLSVILNNGIGDIIYDWYKLIHFVKTGYNITVMVGDHTPRRSHQIMGCLKGMVDFQYIKGIDYRDYWLVQIEDLLNPPPESLYDGVPVLYINSFLETNRNLSEFMPDVPIDYDIEITTDPGSIHWAKQTVGSDHYHIVLYCSNYSNNINCKMFPEPDFWSDMAQLCHAWQGSNLPLHVSVIGATYDQDLSKDVFDMLTERGVSCDLMLDNSFYRVIELIRHTNFVVTYESGMGMIADALKTPCAEFFRCQGGERDDKAFPFLGPINPAGIWNRFFPFFYDDTVETVKLAIDKI